MWVTIFFTPKDIGEYRAISLVEYLWKVIAIIIDWNLVEFIKFHNFLHGFRAQRGTGKSTLESKLLQNIVGLWKEVLFYIFVDLHKAYVALERGRAMEIM